MIPLEQTLILPRTCRRFASAPGEGENAWANIGDRRYQIEYPEWGLDRGGDHKTTYFYIVPLGLLDETAPEAFKQRCPGTDLVMLDGSIPKGVLDAALARAVKGRRVVDLSACEHLTEDGLRCFVRAF